MVTVTKGGDTTPACSCLFLVHSSLWYLNLKWHETVTTNAHGGVLKESVSINYLFVALLRHKELKMKFAVSQSDLENREHWEQFRI